MTLRARTRALLLASSAIYVIVGVISLRGALQLIDSERWVRHTHEVLGALQEVRVGVSQADSMTRGFVLTGSDEFLDGLSDVEQRVPRQLDAVARLTEDNPIQQEHVKHLRGLVARRMQRLRAAVETHLRKGPPADSLSPLVLQGHVAMDEISRTLQSMSDEESRLLTARSQKARAVARTTIVAISTGIVATLLLLLLGRQILIWTINRPVELLLNGVDRFSAGALGFRIPLPPGDELGRIAAALNQMAERRHLVETELKQTSMLLDAIISAMPIAVIGLDGTGKVTTWNPAASHLLGWSPAEVLGSPPPIPLTCQLEGPNPRRTVELECTRRDGSRLEARVITSELVVGNGSAGMIAILEDITHRKEGERERERLLESSRRLVHRLEAIVHASIALGDEVSKPDGVSRVLQGIADWARRLTGADYAALGIGTDSGKPFHPWVFSGMDPEVFRKLGHYPRPVGVLGWVARQGQSMRVEDVHVSPLFQKLPSGHPELGPFLGIPVRYETRSMGNLYLANKEGGPPFTEEDQRIIELLAAYAGVLIENSNLHLGLAKALKSREEVLAVVSHDLRNPLNAIALSTRLLPRIRHNDELFSRKVDVIRSTVEQMSQLIEELINAGAIEAGRLSLHRQPHDIEACLREVVEMLRPAALEKEQHLELQLDPGLPLVLYDLPRMRQVVANLVGNAIKYTDTHGTLHISARCEQDELVVCVQDSGPGIAAEDLPRLFDRYWRVRGASQSGTGLGLYIVKGIIEAHGGRTWVESEVGRGSRFYFSLPLSRLPAERELPT
jgi:PAS domain S-box-containing protein